MEDRFVFSPLPPPSSTGLIDFRSPAHKKTADGRIYFTVPHLFETSLCLLGAQTQTQSDNDTDTEKREKSGGDGWFFVHVEFLIGVGGDLTGLQGLSFSSFRSTYISLEHLLTPFSPSSLQNSHANQQV